MENYFQLFSNCVPVKGYNRSIIIDVQRNDYFFITNDLFEILTDKTNKNISEIKRKYNNKSRMSGDIKFRPRFSIYKSIIHQSFKEKQHSNINGWKRKSFG